jgi:hypothetical protein
VDTIPQLILGFFIAFLLHEITHLIILLLYKVPINSIIVTKWSGVGFLVENDKYIFNNKILSLVYFLPLFWCLIYFINPNEPFFLMFPLVNLSGGIGDFYIFIRLMLMPEEKRLAWANSSDEKILKSTIWKKDIRHRGIIQN